MKDYAPFKPGRRRYRLIVQADHKAIPPIIRMRRLLKRLLRSFGFTCLEVVDITHGGTPCTARCAELRAAKANTTSAATPPPSDSTSADQKPKRGSAKS